MKKKIWILNHYATDMYFNRGGRHYFFAKHMIAQGYNPIIICANVRHGREEIIPVDKGLFVEKVLDGITFIFVKTIGYGESKIKRVFSMLQYYNRVKRIAKMLLDPDIIIGSSVHPLACVAANQLAKKYRCKSICEVRDLWPESIIAYGILAPKSLLSKLLYAGEKWIYKRSDKIIMTWAGGYDYIKKRGWSKDIPASKVVHISNGVDLESFYSNMYESKYEDKDLQRTDVKKFVYMGSIRAVNNLKMLVDTAELLSQLDNSNVLILVWGEGNQRQILSELVEQKGLNNIVFKGAVQKQFVPSILKQADFSILHNNRSSLDIYGQSQNKFFEYLAVGQPILMTYTVGYSICSKQNCGIEIKEQSPEAIAITIKQMSELNDDEYIGYCQNALKVAKQYDFKILTSKLINVIENI